MRKLTLVACREPEVRALMRSCPKSLTGRRNRALLALLYGAALRASELVSLDLGDLDVRDIQEATLQVRRGKGQRHRTVALDPGTAAEVKAWLLVRPTTLPGRVLLPVLHARGGSQGHEARPGAPLQRRYLNHLLLRLSQRAGVDLARLHPHSLRHGRAVDLLKAGASLVTIQRFLGHSNVATTSVYLGGFGADEAAAEIRTLGRTSFGAEG